MQCVHKMHDNISVRLNVNGESGQHNLLPDVMSHGVFIHKNINKKISATFLNQRNLPWDPLASDESFGKPLQKKN